MKQKEIDDAEALLAQKKAEAEKAEFDKWKELITIEDQGQMEETEQSISDFIQYIERRKIVMIEELATEFKMSSRDAITRIEQLMEQKRLSGITDDRGKFIHITEQEFESVAKYVLAKGRVNRQELLNEANKLIRLDPTA